MGIDVLAKSCDECKGPFSRGCEAKRWSHWTCSSLGTIFQPMRINTVPGVKWFCNNKSVLRAQSMVWHFVRHPVVQESRHMLHRTQSTRSPILTWLSRLAQSGRWSSFGKRVWFTESNIDLIIYFYLFYLVNLFLI